MHYGCHHIIAAFSYSPPSFFNLLHDHTLPFGSPLCFDNCTTNSISLFDPLQPQWQHQSRCKPAMMADNTGGFDIATPMEQAIVPEQNVVRSSTLKHKSTAEVSNTETAIVLYDSDGEDEEDELRIHHENWIVPKNELSMVLKLERRVREKYDDAIHGYEAKKDHLPMHPAFEPEFYEIGNAMTGLVDDAMMLVKNAVYSDGDTKRVTSYLMDRFNIKWPNPITFGIRGNSGVGMQKSGFCSPAQADQEQGKVTASITSWTSRTCL